MRRILLPILAIGILLLGACGGGEEEGAAPPTEAPPAAPTTEEPAPPPTPTPTPEPTPPEEPASIPEPEQIEASDSRVTIVLDKVERADVMPADIVGALSSRLNPYQPPTPAEGCDFFCVYLTITRIEGIHMVDALGYGDEEAALFNAKAQKFKRITAQVRGIVYLDPHDIRGPYEVAEGATSFWVFEVPKDEDPLKFEFVYAFKESFDEETEQRGQIDLILEGL